MIHEKKKYKKSNVITFLFVLNSHVLKSVTKIKS